MLKSESFLELRWSLVLSLVREGELQVDEADLFKAVQAWVSRNPTERRRYVDEVRCGFRFVSFRVPFRSAMTLLLFASSHWLLPCSPAVVVASACLCRRLFCGVLEAPSCAAVP